MVNVLKEIGIQQWRLRTDRDEQTIDVETKKAEDRQTESVQVEAVQVQVGQETTNFSASSQVEQPSFNEPVKPTPVTSQEVVEPIHNPNAAVQPIEETASVSGFSGSLKQALKQSNQIKVGESGPSLIKNELKRSDDNKRVVPEVSEEIRTKVAVPLNLSELIDSDQADQVAPDPVFADISGSVPFVDGAVVEENLAGEVNDDISWDDLHNRIKTNEHCPSCGWGNAFLGSGNQQADWFFVVDAPNVRDVEAKAMFSGRAGQLFEAMLAAVGLDREQVYATSIFKCVPTDDLGVTPQCDSIIRQQIKLVSPKVIITFGEFAAQAVIKSNLPLKDLRLNNHEFASLNTPVVPTYSPSQMLDDTSLKAFVWQDLKKSLSISPV